jgi:Uma2 family endonuclease
MTTSPIRTKRWTRAEYDRLIDLGFFDVDDQVELIGGDLMAAEPRSAEHYTAICKSARALEAAFGPGWAVRMQGPVALDDESEPEPDLAVVPGTIDDYRAEHPSRPALTVEISVSSLSTDRRQKGSLYARAGLADYWIVNLVARVLEIYRGPVPDPDARFGWRYARREVIDAAGHASPLAAPSASVPVASLLP